MLMKYPKSTLHANLVAAHLYVFADCLYDLQIELLGWGCGQVNVTQQTVDDL